MKKTYRNPLTLALAALLCLFLANPANAQRPGSGGGGGGGGGSSRPSGGGGGGGGSSARPSVSPSTGSSSTFSRPSGMYAPQRSAVQSGAIRQGGVVRGNYGYAPRTGISAVRGNYAPRVGTTTTTAVRGNYGYVPRAGALSAGVRTGTVGGGNYRTYTTGGYGGYWGTHNYIYHNRGYYNSYYLPSLGFACTVLPYGYYPFYYGDEQYYFSNGLYYQYDNNQYTVVEPPVGAQVTTLPDKAQSIVINGQQYYELNGVYYQPYTKDDGTVVYQVAGKDGELNTNTVDDSQQQGPQMGDIVLQLPQDCRKITVNGQKLYVSPDGIYYQEIVDANGNKSYKIVGLPTDEPDQQQQGQE